MKSNFETIYNMLSKYYSADDTASDFMQDLFIGMLEEKTDGLKNLKRQIDSANLGIALDQIKAIGAIKRAVKNKVIDHYRKQVKHVDYIDYFKSTADDFWADYDQKRTLADCMEAIESKLNEKELSIFKAYYIAGQKQKEIAKNMGISAVAVNKRIKKIQGKIRRLNKAFNLENIDARYILPDYAERAPKGWYQHKEPNGEVIQYHQSEFEAVMADVDKGLDTLKDKLEAWVESWYDYHIPTRVDLPAV